MPTKNLGTVKLNFVSTVAPQANLQVLWYDINPGQNVHKYWDVALQEWVPLKNFGPGQLQQLLQQLKLFGGLQDSVLTKVTDNDGDYNWIPLDQLLNLNGGNTSEVLTKLSNSDKDYDWQVYSPGGLTSVAESIQFTLASQGAQQSIDLTTLQSPVVGREVICEIIESDLINSFVRQADVGVDYEVEFDEVSGSLITMRVIKLQPGSRNVTVNILTNGFV